MARTRCALCERPTGTCLCGWVRATANRLPVLLLQHPLEARQSKGTGRLLALSLDYCRLEVGEDFNPGTLDTWLAELGPAPALLYPHTQAAPAQAAPSRAMPDETAAERPVTGLVVIDATWRKSLRMLHRNAALQGLPRHALIAPPPSRYAIRVAPRADQRSTLEATCLALAGLEGEGAERRYAALLAGFDAFVAASAARVPVMAAGGAAL